MVRASDLPTMDFFCTGGRIDAYFLIEKTSGEIIYQSEYVKNDLTPVFTSAVIRTTNEDVNSESLVFKWFDWDRFGKDEYKVVFQEFCENGRKWLKVTKNCLKSLKIKNTTVFLPKIRYLKKPPCT